MNKTIRAFAPASVGNVACGFDVFGLAINEPGDEVVLTQTQRPGIAITQITGDGGRLSRDPSINTAGVSLKAYLEHIDFAHGFEIELYKHMPLGSGLGSSAASAVAAVFAANELLDRPLQRRELLQFVLLSERKVSGSLHADNAAASLLGGFVIVRSYDPLDVISIEVPGDLICSVVLPELEILTEKSRSILPRQVPMEKAIQQWGNTAGLVAGLMLNDKGLIGRSLNDVIVEPLRASLIPGFGQVKQSAMEAGALGCSISGSGPTVFALSDNEDTARTVGAAMKSAFAEADLDSQIFISSINRVGARIVE